MRNATTVLGVLRDRGLRKLPLEDLYRQLFNPELYLYAYGRIYRNDGAMTPGITPETADGMSLDKINALIEQLRSERYRWTPVRRVEIPKKNGKTRPLGIPTWSDKLLQEVIRLLLEAYYDPQMSDQSHGFRPGRGCHTALMEVQRNWTGARWFIEGDIRGFFDNIDHEILLSILREKIHDNRFLRLISHLLQAGYCEQWKFTPTLSGAPQGSIVSPLLANLYLDRLDKFVEKTLIPEYTRGGLKARNPAYTALTTKVATLRRQKKWEELRETEKLRRTLPTTDTHDPEHRRLRYVRYADDWLLGFVGPKAEAEEIKGKLKAFLQEELKLELSDEKTLITHATTQAARFLNYEIATLHCDEKRRINGRVSLRLPADALHAKCALYERNGKAIHKPEWLQDSDFAIVARYQLQYRGYVQYYALAQNLSWMTKLHWVMETSLLKTLANKHRSSVQKMAQKYRATYATPHGPRKCLKVTVEREGKRPLVAYFGGISLRRNANAVLQDKPTHRPLLHYTELVQRFLAEECEVCGSTDKIEVHHVRKLADLKVKGRREKPLWIQMMAAKRRKTLVLCRRCHEDLHAGRPLVNRLISK